MAALRLKPRLNYNYTLRDAFKAFRGILKREPDTLIVSSFFGVDNLFFVNHARTGLRIALTAMNLPPGSGIGVTPFNCPTVFSAIRRAGHRPVFIDLTDGFTPDPEDLGRKSRELSALIITHLFGIPCDVARLREIAGSIPVIEDCAHSFLSYDENGYTGTQGDFGLFSTGRGKFPSIGEGGMLFINNPRYLSGAKAIITALPPRSPLSEAVNIVKGLLLGFAHLSLVYGVVTFPLFKRRRLRKERLSDSRFNEAKALRSDVQLFLSRFADYAEMADQQRENALYNCRVLSEMVGGIGCGMPAVIRGWNCFMVPLLCRERDQIIEAALNHGIELGRHFALSVKCAGEYGYNSGECPRAEYIAAHIAALPTYYKMRPLNEGSD